MDTGGGRDNGMGHGCVRCLSRIAGVHERNVSYFVTHSTRPRARTLARVRERIGHTNEIRRVSLGCILALGSLFFFYPSLLALLLLLSSPRFFFYSPSAIRTRSRRRHGEESE